MALDLKEYQRECLDRLGHYCDLVRHHRSRSAVRPIHDAYAESTEGRDYNTHPLFPDTPYICLRVPTGGGKTLIAAHAVGTIARRLGHQDYPLCLWVTPSTTIRDQTLNALKQRGHPYHAALRDSLGVPVEVLTIEQALELNRATVLSSAVIIVTTIQSYRIDNEANRRIYQDNGYLMALFDDLPAEVKQQLQASAGDGGYLTLANAMRMRRPIVIMDEAHNAQTRISFESLARFGPMAVMEMTATPQQDHDPAREQFGSNVLHAVSALQLKREGMIKLPIELESRDNWMDVLTATVERRAQLEARAVAFGRESGRFIRPIALIQAQPRRQARETHTADAIREALIQQLHVPAERIRIATGDNDELGDEDLKHPDCKVEYIITVDKLREGWDCSFAYVLGSVGNVATETAVEQLLGRVMRMPDAVPTAIPELDRAYAIVQSEDVAATAARLCDSLVKRCGFDADSVNDAFRIRRHADPQGRLPIAAIPVSAPPNLATLTPALREQVEYDGESGNVLLRAPLTREEAVALRDTMTTLTDQAAVEEYWQREREIGTAARRLEEYAEPVRVPQLAVRDGQRSYLFEPEELDEFDWGLDRCNVAMADADFSIELNIGDRVAVSVTDAGAVRVGSVQGIVVRQLSLVTEGDDWSAAELVRWLDRELHRNGQFAGLQASLSQPWLQRVIDGLLQQRGASLPILVRKRHELADVVIRRITAHGRQQVRAAAELLIAQRSTRRLETLPAHAFTLAEVAYCAYRRYHGAFTFRKHAFELIGDMGNEESQCAKKIDDHPNVKRWLRNLIYESAGGFSLPLSPGRFFPDFIVELVDGRIAIVEYKGGHLAHRPEEMHKEVVGKLWEGRSGGRCLFVRVVDRDWDKLERALSPVNPAPTASGPGDRR